MNTRQKANVKLPSGISRIIYVRNLPFKINEEELYDIFGKFGTIRQIRRGTVGHARGSAFVVYEDVYDAKKALDQLTGFNVGGRYLVVLYFKGTHTEKKSESIILKSNPEYLKEKYHLL